MSGIYAIIPTASLAVLNAVGKALGRGQLFSGYLTDDPDPTPESTITHHHFYDAVATPAEFSILAAAKAGEALPLHNNGNPVAWGTGDAPTEAAAYAAFATMQMWANDSTREPADFAEEQRAGLGLSLWSPI